MTTTHLALIGFALYFGSMLLGMYVLLRFGSEQVPDDLDID